MAWRMTRRKPLRSTDSSNQVNDAIISELKPLMAGLSELQNNFFENKLKR